jgi:hypothetical protein
MTTRIGNISKEFDLEKMLGQLRSNPGYEADICYFENYKNNLQTYKKTGIPSDMKWVIPLFEAGYKDPINRAATHNPGVHFDSDIIYFLDKKLGTYCVQAWVNRLEPGQFMPLHIDNDKKDHLLEYGELESYSIHIGEPQPGHLFFIENHCHYMEPSGEMYKWNDRFSLHGGANIGYTTKYILIYQGLRPKQPFNFTYKWSDNMTPISMELDNGTIL